MAVLVVGSFMTDLVVRTNTTPSKGQTVMGNSFNIFLGGKGANQAVASKRMGSKTYLVGALGDDSFGRNFKAFFKEEGFDVSHILTKNTSSGVGQITINEETGDNQIVIVPGANLSFSVSDLHQFKHLFKDVDIVVNQLEMQDEVIFETKRLAKQHNKLYLLNPAPFKELPDAFLKDIDFITPNETELEGFVGRKLTTMDDFIDGAKELLQKGVKNVIVTLGGNGALHCDIWGCKHYKPFAKEVVDTVAAGDAFNGTFASQISQGKSIDEAMIYANGAGAVTVTRHGAIPSIPTFKEVEQFIKNQK